MKNKVLMVVLFVSGIVAGLGATSVFAQGPAPWAQTSDNQTWQQMQQACINGDYQTMERLHDQYCGWGDEQGPLQEGQQGNYGSGPWGMMGGWRNSNGSTGYGGMMGNW